MPTRAATSVVVTIDGSPLENLRPLSVRRTSGGQVRDEATYLLDLGAAGQYIQDLAMLPGGEICEITAYPNGVPTLLHWGKVDAASIQIGDNETLSFTSRVEPYHLGVVMDGVWIWEPLTGQLVLVPQDLVFNPRIDDETMPNQSQIPRLLGLASVILDPESCRTQAALTVQGDSPTFWTVQSAAQYLCWALNPSQTWVNNPDAVSIALLPEWPLNHFHLPRGKFLGEYLDDLLSKFGLSWYLDLSTGKPQISFFLHGAGLANTVYLGPPGALYNGDNALDTDLHYDVGSARNQAVAQGDWHYVEDTFYLSKGWPSSLDATAETSLAKGNTNFQNPANTYRDVHRKWVSNEAGDYIGTRPEITSVNDFSGLFGHPVAPRRRKFLPCITLDSDGAPYGRTAGCMIEYSIDGGSTWQAIEQLSDASVKILDRECGIYFDGQFPPVELRRACQTSHSSAQVRITATVRDDSRLQSSIGPDATSPLGDLAPFFVDASAGFHWREVLDSSKLYAQVSNGTLKSSQANDFDALETYATWLQEGYDVGDVHGRLVLEGLDTSGTIGPYALGQLISGIAGRNVDLNAQSAGGVGRYPQVVGIDYDFQRQRMTLRLETFRDPIVQEGLESWEVARQVIAAGQTQAQQQATQKAASAYRIAGLGAG